MTFKVSIYRYFTIPNILIAVINVLANAFLIDALRKLKKLRSISHQFIALLSISDVCIGVSLLLTEPVFWFVSEEKDILILRICSGISLFAFCQFSGLMTLAIAVDRYIHMKYLIKYSVIMTQYRAKILIVLNVIASLLSTAISMAGVAYNFAFISSLVPSLGLFAILSILSILYYGAYRSIRLRTEQIELDSGMKSIPRVSKSPNKEFCRSVLIILSSLWICYAPSVVFTAANNQGEAADWKMICLFCSLMLMYLNSFMNVVILISSNRQLRHYTWQQIKCHSSQPEQFETSLNDANRGTISHQSKEFNSREC